MGIRNNWRRGPPTRATLLLRWSRNLCLGIGVLLLGYYSYVWIDARLFEADQSARFQQELQKRAPVNGGVGTLRPSPPPAGMAKSKPIRPASPGIAIDPGTALGRIESSAIGLEAMIMEGTDAKTLRRGVGHIAGTPLPGQPGNVAIAGHRDTFFRPLLKICKDDEITLTTLAGSYRYRVNSTKVVEPNDMTVLDNSEAAMLTLVTCYPFYYVGPAPKRFIVRAHRISAEVLESRMHPDTR